jgi:hypothetical protein
LEVVSCCGGRRRRRRRRERRRRSGARRSGPGCDGSGGLCIVVGKPFDVGFVPERGKPRFFIFSFRSFMLKQDASPSAFILGGFFLTWFSF